MKKAKKGKPGRPKNGATSERLTIIFKEEYLKYFVAKRAELEDRWKRPVGKTETFEFILSSMKDFKSKTKE